MSLFADRRSQLTRRMKIVEKELSAVDASIRTLSRKLDRRSDELLDRDDWQYEDQRDENQPDTPEPVPAQDAPLEVTEGQLGVLLEKKPATPARVGNAGGRYGGKKSGADGTVASRNLRVGTGLLRQDKSEDSAGGADGELAGYFVGGGLQHSGPLRQEKRVQRNKAIFLILFFFLILFVVCFSIWR